MDGGDNGTDVSLNKLEHANQKLKEQNSSLADKLNTSSHKLHNRVSTIAINSKKLDNLSMESVIVRAQLDSASLKLV